MPVLAIETATELAGVAVADGDGVLAAATLARGRRHGESVAPAVAFVCARAGLALDELHGLAVDVGPGLFTGLRVGVASAKALGFALGLPVVTATSLEVLAGAAARAGAVADGSLVVPVVDARRGQVFSARFTVDGAGAARAGDEVLWDPEALAADLAALGAAGRRCLCVGDGALRYRHLLADVAGVTVGGDSFAHPDVQLLARLGVERHAAGLAVPAEAVSAHYLREADVRINWEQRIAPRTGGT